MPLSQLPTGDETILVLSREEALCSTIKQILEVLGYEVRISGDPQEALRLLHGTEVDMLLVDAAVQYASVREAWLRQARAARPRLKLVIAADGGGAGQRAADSVGAVLLSKPFSLADLADAVRRALAVEPDAR
jgi:DNA-binding NtrC family response regulator